MTQAIDVVGAAIVRDGLVLSTQRGSGPLSGLWEFPGGKVEASETHSEALRREIREELRVEIEVGDALQTTHHAYEFVTVNLTVYRSVLKSGELNLTEHTAARWLRPEDLLTLKWAPADLPSATALADGVRR